MKRIFILALLIAPVIASAQVIEEVYSKEGSVYSGYISEQHPGKQMSVYVEYAYMVFNKADVVDSRKDYYDFNLLPDRSKALIRDICDTSSLYLTSLMYKGQHYENLYVKEVSETAYYAYSLAPRTYILPWNSIVKICKVPLEGYPYGIREVVTLKNGERIVGQILEQETAKGMTIKDVDGRLHRVNSNDVLSVLVEKISDKHNMWEQTPLLDRIVTADGTMLEGLITSRILGQNVNLLMKFSSEPQQLRVENIKKYQKTRNKEFNKYVVDTAKIVRLNDADVKLVALVKEKNMYVVKDENFSTFNMGTELSLVIKNIPHGKTVGIYELRTVKKKKIESIVMQADALPVYETTFNKSDDYKECYLVIRKPGKYYISVDGFESGLNVVFENKEE